MSENKNKKKRTKVVRKVVISLKRSKNAVKRGMKAFTGKKKDEFNGFDLRNMSLKDLTDIDDQAGYRRPD